MHLSVVVSVLLFHTTLAEMYKDELKEFILKSLVRQGFTINNETGKLSLSSETKDSIRLLHNISRLHVIDKNRNFVERNFNKCSVYFANGSEVNVSRFSPVVIPVETGSEYADLYRFSSLLWSIPVSNGFGRRQRFVVIDKSNNKIVGIFALGDPVYNIRVRDKCIGWKNSDRKLKLYNMMDLFVAGAFPPYSNLLCGKLVAMLAISDEIRRYIFEKYKSVNTVIQNTEKDPTLVAITTSSAFGRSSQYNRISFNGDIIYKPIGYSQGWGHFHLTNGLYANIKTFLRERGSQELQRHNFGDGPNWKFRILRAAFRELELSQDLLFHGVQRQLFIAPLAFNYKDFFCLSDIKLKMISYPQNELIDYFKSRWFLPRACRSCGFETVKAATTLASLNNRF